MRTDRWSDVSQIDGREKHWHDWQQSLAEVETLVGYFSDPGDLVVDPCLGGGTTALACRRLGRTFVGCDVSAECASKTRLRLSDCPPVAPAVADYQTVDTPSHVAAEGAATTQR